MARIEYCDEDTSWHPAYALLDDSCWDFGADDDWASLNESYVLAYVQLVENAKKKEFAELAAQWKRETALYGYLSKIVMHPAYQRIMAMGPEVIPFILSDLEKKPVHWFWALHNLAPKGQDPAEGLTTIEDARQAWLKWGRDNNYL
jgi:hypothetical protein